MTDFFDRGEYLVVPLRKLVPGQRLRAPVYDAKSDRSDRSVLLLAEGAQLTKNLLDLLTRRGVTDVRVHASELSRLVQHDAPQLTSRQATDTSSTKTHFRTTPESFLHEVVRRDTPEPPPALVAEFIAGVDRSHRQISDVFSNFERKGAVASDLVQMVANDQIELLRKDFDQFVSHGVEPVERDYPSRHSLQTSMLAVSIGAVMGLKKSELNDLGFGCLIHDAGLLKVPREIYEQPSGLSRSDWLELAKHPIHISDALNASLHVPHGARMVAYQMHERMNGSGYPRHRYGHQIHRLARIAAVADTYLAMVSPRPHRAGLHPYVAMEQLLYSTQQGLFDPAVVRALLHTTSLFPVGAEVELSDGTHATVLRGNMQDYMRPTVAVRVSSVATILDLRESLQLVVSRAVVEEQ